MPKEFTITHFAQLMNCDRRNIYYIFSKDNIDIQLLWRVSKILGHDFFKDISDSISLK